MHLGKNVKEILSINTNSQTLTYLFGSLFVFKKAFLYDALSFTQKIFWFASLKPNLKQKVDYSF